MADPSPKSTGDAPTLTRRRITPGPFLGWLAVGALWALSIVTMLSIGMFLMPVALIVTVVMCMGYTRPDGWPGSIAGFALIALYLAFLHRHGPGQYCTGTGASVTCVDQLNPWLFLAAGVALILVCALVCWRWATRPTKPRHWRSRA